MKKCPFCAEEIQDEAIKCKHCGEMLEKQPEVDQFGALINAKELSSAQTAAFYADEDKKRGERHRASDRAVRAAVPTHSSAPELSKPIVKTEPSAPSFSAPRVDMTPRRIDLSAPITITWKRAAKAAGVFLVVLIVWSEAHWLLWGRNAEYQRGRGQGLIDGVTWADTTGVYVSDATMDSIADSNTELRRRVSRAEGSVFADGYINGMKEAAKKRMHEKYGK